MRRINLKRSVAIALAAVTVAGSAFVPSSTAQAASKKSVYVVTEVASNSGGKTKLSYNKNGLVTKAVFSDSSSSKSKDTNVKATTKYSYNKKNQIKSSKYSSTETSVSYKTYGSGTMSGERVPGATPATYTYTTTSDAAYTYNKKGKLTQKVETSVYASYGEGSINPYTYNGTTEVQVAVPDSNGYYVECTADDDWDYSIGSKYYESSYSSSDTDKQRYRISYVEIPYTTTRTTTSTVAAGADGSVVTTTTTTGTELDYSATQAAGTAVYKNYTETETETKSNKTVTTTNYTLDKKKRVKKAEAVAVNTITTITNSTDRDGDKTDITETEEYTRRYTTTYKYNKKGRATKVVTFSEPDVKYTDNSTTTDTYVSTGKVSTRTSSTVEENGMSTYTSTYPSTDAAGNAITKTYTRTELHPANTSTRTSTYKYDKAGNVKSSKATYVDTNNRTYIYTYNADGSTTGGYQTVAGVDSDGDPFTYPAYTTKVTTTTSTNKKDVEVKNNSNRITKKIGMNTNLAEGEKKSSYDVTRTVYKVKSKKGVSAVEKQQWIIQNSMLNGQEGLDLGIN